MNHQNNAPIDFVMIWVDGNDPEWRQEKAKYDGKTVTASNSEVRYRDWDNLQYWFRGVEKYAPWVNKIHFVTWGHIPPWLDTTNPKINVVKHTDYIPEEYLPTFSSHTIELNLHRIDGLAEQFVYFNDDMFFTAPVKPEDFFKDGKPCDTAALDCIFFGKDSAGPFNGSDITVINSHFKKKRILKRDWKKWYNLKNGFRNVVKTLLLYPWPWFPGLYYQHACNSFLKSTFNTVWSKEFEALDETCRHRFRKSGDLNQWVMKFWQFAEGNFEVRPEKFAYCYHVKESNFAALLEDIPSGRRNLLCINDTARTRRFEDKKQKLIEVFEKCFPSVSEFEKAEYYEISKDSKSPEVENLEEQLKQRLRQKLYEGIYFFEQTLKIASEVKSKTLSYSRKLFTISRVVEYLKIEQSPYEVIDEADANKFLLLLKNTVDLIEDRVIADADISYYYKLLILKIKTKNEPELFFEDNDIKIGCDEVLRESLLENSLGIQKINIDGNFLSIEGCFSCYGSILQDAEVTVLANGEYTNCQKISKEDTRHSLGANIQTKIGFRTEIEFSRIKDGKISFILKAGNHEEVFKNISLSNTAPISNTLKKSYYIKNGIKITSDGEFLWVKRAGAFTRLLSEAAFIAEILRRNKDGGKKAVAVRLALPLMKLFVKKPVWIIEAGEKPTESIAFSFFKYVCENRRDVDVKLVVPEKYTDDGTVSSVGGVLNRETRKYKRMVLLSSAIILEYPYERIYNPFRRRFGFYKDILNEKNILCINEDWQNFAPDSIDELFLNGLSVGELADNEVEEA